MPKLYKSFNFVTTLAKKVIFVISLGCTPLHWAALRGNLEACVVLLHSGAKEELMVIDSAGFTRAQIAADRGHRHVCLILVCLMSLFY